MKRKHNAISILAFLALLAGGCAGGSSGAAQLPPGQKLRMTPDAWSQYQAYLQDLGGGQRTGAFAVALLGDTAIAGAWTYCPPGVPRCVYRGHAGPGNQALEVCRQSGLDCMLFAQNKDILVDYEIVQ